jgi:hypothetical protein
MRNEKKSKMISSSFTQDSRTPNIPTPIIFSLTEEEIMAFDSIFFYTFLRKNCFVYILNCFLDNIEERSTLKKPVQPRAIKRWKK